MAAQAVGLTMRRTQPAGAVITAAGLEAPEVVRRGELVTLTSGDGAISVKAEGVALEPARLHQRLKVRSASGRVHRGNGRGPGPGSGGLLSHMRAKVRPKVCLARVDKRPKAHSAGDAL